jgi:hypothetical protein
MTALGELDLTTTPVTDEAMTHIARLTALERLSLADSDITDEGIGHWSTYPTWFRSICGPSISAIPA